MSTHLIFYWYVASDGWHEIYDLHLKSLLMFAHKFDEVTFVIAKDDGLGNGYENLVAETVLKLYNIVPSAEFISYGNDKVLRESLYFRNEIALKLDSFSSDELVFFAHNKGVASTYVPKDELDKWIKAMYYINLSDFQRILGYFDNGSVCSVGTRKISNARQWPFLKYKWHYSGTFMWFSPSRVLGMMRKNNDVVPKNDRYFTEGFLGSVVPDRQSIGLSDKEESVRKAFMSFYDEG